MSDQASPDQAQTPNAAQAQPVAPAAEDESANVSAADSVAGAGRSDPSTGVSVAEQLANVVAASENGMQGLDLLKDVELNVRIELGRARMPVEDVLKLGEGAVVELDKLAGDPVDIYVNECLVARGEVLVLNDNFCVRISQIISDQD